MASTPEGRAILERAVEANDGVRIKINANETGPSEAKYKDGVII